MLADGELVEPGSYATVSFELFEVERGLRSRVARELERARGSRCFLLSKQADHVREATSMVNDATRLLGLNGLAVTKVVAAGNGMEDGPVVHPATTDERARCCPERGVAAVRVK